MFSSKDSQSDTVNYVEDVFSTYLYTGNGSTQTITNGIDLSTKGGLVWIKDRTVAFNHVLFDTARGATNFLISNTTAANESRANSLTSFNNNGFSLGNDSLGNSSGSNIVSWTFRKQPKFFDVVTYTGNGTSQTISHNLGSTPGSIFVKRTDVAANWIVYHIGLSSPNGIHLKLNSTASQDGNNDMVNGTSSTTFSVGSEVAVNASAGTYVAYIFAHNAGGFGLSGSDNVISCGSYTGNGAAGGQLINLGYEAQWVMIKQTNSSGNWWMMDTMRGYTVNGDFGSDTGLFADLSNAESNQVMGQPSAQGFTPIQDNVNQSGQSYIYIAIRRGPMKVPTVGTSVFTPSYGLNAGVNGQAWDAGFPVDMYIRVNPSGVAFYTSDRLRNPLNSLLTNTTGAESTVAFSNKLDNNIGVFSTNAYDYTTWIGWLFRRASSFFDEVCWTRSTTTATLNHNLGVVPELIIKKDRSRAGTYWDVMPNVSPYDYRYDIYLNDTQAISGPSSIYWNAAPTATTFDVHMGFDGSSNGDTFVAYLFATLAGVSKVGSYTGTGALLTVNCGFTSGARFVLIKRTDSTGDWYVWDTARGIVAGNDPYLLLNSSASEVTNTDYIDAYSAGFEISSTAPAAINASAGTYIFLAIA